MHRPLCGSPVGNAGHPRGFQDARSLGEGVSALIASHANPALVVGAGCSTNAAIPTLPVAAGHYIRTREVDIHNIWEGPKNK